MINVPLYNHRAIVMLDINRSWRRIVLVMAIFRLLVVAIGIATLAMITLPAIC
jgi:hypothetical protein